MYVSTIVSITLVLRLSGTLSTFDCFKPASMLYETYADKSGFAPQTAYERCFGSPMFADLHTVSVNRLLSLTETSVRKLILSQPEHKETALVRSVPIALESALHISSISPMRFAALQ